METSGYVSLKRVDVGQKGRNIESTYYKLCKDL